MRTIDYVKSRQRWNGVEIEVAWCPDWLSFDDGTATGHLQVQSVTPAREPLPITNTGYRSHFIHAALIAEYGGPDEFVRRWLEQEAKSAAWHESEAARR